MKRSNRWLWLGAIAIGVLVLLTFIAAPNSSKINTGSTYGRAPDGYGAWYAFMQQRSTQIQRWEKPFSELSREKRPVTLVQIYSQLQEPELSQKELEWIEKGNTLVMLGVRARVSTANFHNMLNSLAGNVKIATRRRQTLQPEEKLSLGDRFGAVVWRETVGKGEVIFSTTPHIAANAYQDYPNNYQYLAELVTKKGHVLLVNEYIHGYRAPTDNKSGENRSEGLLGYFAQTPLFPVFVQLGVLLLVLIWAKNRRFGKPVTLEAPVIDNSEAYIQALAGVLQKAESIDFVVETIGKEEQLQLQKALGLGQELLDQQSLIDVWVQQTGYSSAELEAALKAQSQQRRMSERDLHTWLSRWQAVRRQVQGNFGNVSAK